MIQGAVRPSHRNAAMKVWVPQCPKGALALTALGFKLGSQFRHRNVAVCFHPADQNIGMGCELATAAGAALLLGFQRTLCRHPLSNPYARTRAHPKSMASRTPRLPAFNLSVNPFPKIARIPFAHDSPPNRVNHKSVSLGIPYDSNFRHDALSAVHARLDRAENRWISWESWRTRGDSNVRPLPSESGGRLRHAAI